MDATCRVNCYAAKAFGLLPLAGGRKPASVLYAASLWTALCTSGMYAVHYHFENTKNVSPKHTMLMRRVDHSRFEAINKFRRCESESSASTVNKSGPKSAVYGS
ncbi:Hypothetical protein CINCED_3A023769 [Cinara cedri]|uniref:Uncharacterized protein n=1 Tax=Cinara cedri TaxID=506608 RepID=A0A5E4MIB1_9HEMI|nr:Hypothetical protein CINCED_3A023769 [Cinara cedri]